MGPVSEHVVCVRVTSSVREVRVYMEYRISHTCTTCARASVHTYVLRQEVVRAL